MCFIFVFLFVQKDRIFFNMLTVHLPKIAYSYPFCFGGAHSGLARLKMNKKVRNCC